MNSLEVALVHSSQHYVWQKKWQGEKKKKERSKEEREEIFFLVVWFTKRKEKENNLLVVVGLTFKFLPLAFSPNLVEKKMVN